MWLALLASATAAPLPPRRDHDQDGVADIADRCPDATEDRDGVEDADGCPDFAPPEREALRLRSIATLEDLLRSPCSSDQRASMLLRLADLRLEQGRYVSLGEQTSSSTDTTISRAWYDKSIRIYRTVLEGYPRLATADTIQLSLAQALSETAQLDAADEVLTRLVTEWPASPSVRAAYVLLGEHLVLRHAGPADLGGAYGSLGLTGKEAHLRVVLARLAERLFEEGRFEAAIEVHRHLVSEHPSGPEPPSSWK